MPFTNKKLKKLVFLPFFLLIHSQNIFAQKPSISSFTPNSTGAYSYVTIIGNNFGGTTAVNFGGTPAAFFFVLGSTTITAQVGLGSSGYISVSTPEGIDSIGGFTFIPPPLITSFSPTKGYSGSVITLKGKYFTGAYYVAFGGVSARSFNILSDSVATAIVSTGASGDITMYSNNGSSALSGFNFIGPTILSFTPTAGSVGTQITITGTNFTGATAVTFGDTPAKSFSVQSNTTITAELGSGSPGNVAVTTAYGTATLAGFIQPFITSFNPSEAGPGDTVVIKGRNFNGTDSLRFGDMPAASFHILSDSNITATVGKGASGNVSIVTTNGTSSVSGFYYLAPPPVVNSFSPGSGGNGTMVVIKGKNFIPQTQVGFGSTPAKSVTVNSDSVITAIVGNGSSGNINITTSGGFATSDSLFVYTGPVINFLSPLSGWQGDTIIISGTNLQNVKSVAFGGIPAAYFTVDSSTAIKAVTGYGNSGVVTATAYNGTASGYQFTFLPLPPQIKSFSPVSGTVGTSVTITGSNFDKSASNDIVYFGAVRAIVKSADSTKIVVTVPAGAENQPFSVTSSVTNLTGYSSTPFAVTFKGGDTSFSSKSFSAKTELYINPGEGSFGALDVVNCDLDGDGKPEIIAMSDIFTNFTVFKNTSTPGHISFDQGTNYSGDGDVASIVATDIDGDGKPDIVITGDGSTYANLWIYRNTSTVGNISFAPVAYVFAYGFDAGGTLAMGDLDGDGKPDFVEAQGNHSSAISIFRNSSTIGHISFDKNIDYAVGELPYGVAIGDINGDKKLDIVVANTYGNSVSILTNNCSLGKISFDYATPFVIDQGVFTVLLGDLDNDNKLDIVVANSNSSSISVFRNTGIGSQVSFAPPIDYATGNTPYGFALSDLNGDGKVDVVVANNGTDSVMLFNNNSTAGNISLEAEASYLTANQPRIVNVGDFDGDGRPDLVTVNWVSNSCSVFRNQMADNTLPITYLSFTAQPTHSGNLLQWQTATEINSAYFNVQRSADGVRFTNIAQVNAAGNSSTVQNYQYTDALTGLNPIPPALFYRLQEADKDGDVTYSKIIKLDNNSASQVNLSIFPNPVHEILNVQLAGITGAATIVITDAIGKTLQVREVNADNGQTISINTQTLAAGVYFIQVLHDKQSTTQKFVKE